MENRIKQNEETLLNAFKIEELEERLEMAPWSTKTHSEISPSTGWVDEYDSDGNYIGSHPR